MILLVDDLRHFADESIEYVQAYTSAEAIAILSKGGRFGEIWLDHDLGMPNGVLDDTRPVVNLLVRHHVGTAAIIVHTSNPVARKWMVPSLQDAGYNVIELVNLKGIFKVDG